MADRAPPTRRLGDWTLHAITDGLFRLDGGAMFGTVPKVLWDRVKPADDQNRIDLCASCKETLMPGWADEGTLVVFPHETRYPWARIARNERGGFQAAPLDKGWLSSLSAPCPGQGRPDRRPRAPDSGHYPPAAPSGPPSSGGRTSS